MPLLFNQSAPSQKILLRPVSAADHVTCHLRIPSSPKEPPLVSIAYLLHDSPREPTNGGPSPFAWVSPGPSRPRQNHPPEISSRPCMAYLINIRIETTNDQDRQPLGFWPLLAFITMSQTRPNVKILRTLLKNTKNISINYLFEYIPNHKIGGDSDGCRLKIFFSFLPSFSI